MAAEYPISEVSLFFNNRLLRGNRSKKIHADGFSAFDSPNFPPLLEAGINIEVIKGTLSQPQNQQLEVTAVSSQPVGVVTLYPGISADVVRNAILQPVNALILLSYGVGNAPQNPALLAQLRSAKEQGIAVVNCTQCVKGRVNMQGYANGSALHKAGLISAQDMTLEACLAKLHYLLSKGLNATQISEQIPRSLRGELSTK